MSKWVHETFLFCTSCTSRHRRIHRVKAGSVPRLPNAWLTWSLDLPFPPERLETLILLALIALDVVSVAFLSISHTRSHFTFPT